MGEAAEWDLAPFAEVARAAEGPVSSHFARYPLLCSKYSQLSSRLPCCDSSSGGSRRPARPARPVPEVSGLQSQPLRQSGPGPLLCHLAWVFLACSKPPNLQQATMRAMHLAIARRRPARPARPGPELSGLRFQPLCPERPRCALAATWRGPSSACSKAPMQPAG
jgi:hypothetical protein